MDTNLISTQYDDKLNGINARKWLPWVGRDYPARPADKRVLIVGESHYGDGADNRKNAEADSNHTRDIFAEIFISKFKTRTFRTIPRVLFNANTLNRENFGLNICYCNIVQKLMAGHKDTGNVQRRPSGDDFKTGWKVLGEIVKVLKPRYCLFIGVSASYTFNPEIFVPADGKTGIEKRQSIERACPRRAKVLVDNAPVDLIFLKHFCRVRSGAKWHDYLQVEHPGLLAALADCY